MGLVKRIRKPEDIGELITSDYIRKLRAIHLGLMILAAASLLIITYIIYSDNVQDSPFSFAFLLNVTLASLLPFLAFMVMTYETNSSFYDGFIYRDMPQSMCEEVLEALDTYSELKFLKDRIANMDRKLTTEEGLYITNYHRVILKKKSEDFCKRLYGINSGDE
ncbi:hypothetical protein KW882_02920 [Vibrio parahaemolyticus]